MVDLSTHYLGLPLANPIVVSASPLSKKIETVQRLEETGASAVVLYSLFEEQILQETQALDDFASLGLESFREAFPYYPDLSRYNVGAAGYLTHISRLKKAVRIPIIGSLNGSTPGGWTDYARRIEEAGADALELNLYFVPTDPHLAAAEIEDAQIEVVQKVRAAIHIPLAVKLSPFYTALPHFAQRLVAAGANSLVLFNRFYQPDLDVETLEVVPSLDLSTSADLRLPLRWVAILSGRLPADLALTGGVHTPEDLVKAVMAGANVALIASELIAHGVERVRALRDGLEDWLVRYEYESIQQMQGSMSQRSVINPAAFERGNYLKILSAYDNRS